MKIKLLCLFGHKWAYVEIMGKNLQRYCERCHTTQYWDERLQRYIPKNILTQDK